MRGKEPLRVSPVPDLRDAAGSHSPCAAMTGIAASRNAGARAASIAGLRDTILAPKVEEP